jgi:heterodisulfide reductase subunit D
METGLGSSKELINSPMNAAEQAIYNIVINIEENDLGNLDKEIKETKVRLCLDCGKCTVVCPVARYDSGFNPRLIIQKSLQDKEHRSAGESIWSCFDCGMCVERCNYKVQFPEFITVLRTASVIDGTRVQCSHGGSLQSAMHMMSRAEIQQKRMDWLPEDITLAEQSDTRFFVGCAPYFDVIFGDIGVKTINGVVGALRLLNKAGIAFNLLANERCCGRDLLIQGDQEGFLNLVKANKEEFNRHGVKRIITYCPECYDCLKNEYPKVTGNKDIQIVNLIELLSPMIKDKKIALGKLEKKLTYHDPCKLGRGFRLFEEPRELLKSISGVDLVEMENNRETSLCCGANPWAYCNAVNRQVQGQRLAQAVAVGAEALVTACPKCQIHLKCAQKNEATKMTAIDIQDLAELAAASLDRR